MTPDEILSIIQRELSQAIGADGSKLSTARRQALEYYEGEPFGNELDGRSQVVMRTVLEVVEWVLPALLRIFTASDKIADIEPLREDQAEAAQQATDYISYIFYRDNNGFLILHDWFKDALISKVGWVKVWWDTQKVEEVNSYTGLSEPEYQALKGKPDATIMDERSYPAPVDLYNYDAPDPEAQPPVLYDCTIRTVREEGRVKIAPVPPEEVLTSRRAKAIDASCPLSRTAASGPTPTFSSKATTPRRSICASAKIRRNSTPSASCATSRTMISRSRPSAPTRPCARSGSTKAISASTITAMASPN
jgi:hypothetical protein